MNTMIGWEIVRQAAGKYFPGKRIERVKFRVDEQGRRVACQLFDRDMIPLGPPREVNADGSLSPILFDGMGKQVRDRVKPDPGTHVRAVVDIDYTQRVATVEYFYQRSANKRRSIETHYF